MACSACCCWVAASPSAFWMSAGTPAALNAAASSGRSAVSQRAEDFVSGSSTATFCALPPPPELVVLAPAAPLEVELESSLPQAATPRETHASVPVSARVRRGPVANIFSSLGG